MKCNLRELAHLSDQTCDFEGRLNYKKVSNGGYLNQSVFKERWFRLVSNYLFYFKISEMGKFDTKNPAGVFIMENSSIDMEHGQNIPFAFSISFMDEPERRHLFAARTEDNVVQWVLKLRTSSYEYLRSRLHTLQSKIFSITGNDPLLLVPRNDGAKLWAPAVPFSTAPACTIASSSFNCHLHTHVFTLERSRSDVQTYQHLREHAASEPVQTTKDELDDIKFVGLERSKTSALLQNRLNPFNGAIFDNRPAYSRAAPSPPVRKKLSPTPHRSNAPSTEFRQFTDQGIHLAKTGILDSVPVPPRRKISPKPLDTNNEPKVTISGHVRSNKNQSEEDLIKFE